MSSKDLMVSSANPTKRDTVTAQSNRAKTGINKSQNIGSDVQNPVEGSASAMFKGQSASLFMRVQTA